MSKVMLGLVHYPIYNKRMEIVTTSVTNMDLHDIARSATTYGVEKYFIIHPVENQKKVVQEIIDYWQQGFGANYNPDRQEALQVLEMKDSVEITLEEIEKNYGAKPKVIVTDARIYPNSITYQDLRNKMEEDDDGIYLILFGTGWGMAKELMEKADYRLYPIYGAGKYNHLSVRSAVAIILDRLLGEKWF